MLGHRQQVKRIRRRNASSPIASNDLPESGLGLFEPFRSYVDRTEELQYLYILLVRSHVLTCQINGRLIISQCIGAEGAGPRREQLAKLLLRALELIDHLLAKRLVMIEPSLAERNQCPPVAGTPAIRVEFTRPDKVFLCQCELTDICQHVTPLHEIRFRSRFQFLQFYGFREIHERLVISTVREKQHSFQIATVVRVVLLDRATDDAQ